MVRVRVIELSSSRREDYKDLIKITDNCITQVLPETPSNNILNQACYILFNSSNHRVKNPSIYFLLLLTDKVQIKDVIMYINSMPKDKVYLIECCKYPYEPLPSNLIASNVERLILTKNSLLSIDSL
ncbi:MULTISPECIES: hypothetical protein [Sulfolobaceae]|uniref:hypothetical protein n=1 Tax=Sulfolobaceae TaxID=118883 RepID=UPI001E35C01A|nr:MULTISPECIES: hypothetical protein [unclassified Sulfolobus]